MGEIIKNRSSKELIKDKVTEKLQEKHEFVRLYFQLYQGKSSL
ncbi:hypothetical protein [Bacillus sp. ISL-46]|nr:hypothetical protein [Bacillus sp. ISL-46]